jgi:predicted CopG family antitoxin
LRTDINQFIQDAIRKRIEDVNYYDRDRLILEACNEFAESTCVMVWKEFYEKFDVDTILEFFTNNEKRNSIMNRMANVEKAGKKLSEIDRRVNMDATHENFANYLKKHNISITEEIFEEFKSMNRFKSFSKYIREHRARMGLNVFLPGDKKVIVSNVKNISIKPIEVVKKNAVIKVVVPEPVKEPVKNIEVRRNEPIKVVRSNCSKELVIIKKNQ